MYSIRSAAACLCGAFLIPLWAAAAPGDLQGGAAAPAEIVVSGYRPQTTQELDTSITVLQSDTLERATLANVEDIVRLVPNMNLSGEGSRARYFQLRGIGEREQYEGAPNPSVGFIVDDIDLSGIAGITSTYDLAQLEVLRGPQSARYGSSALAGMVYVQTENPTARPSVRAELTSGNNDTRGWGGAISGPLTESLRGRFSAYRYQDNGFRRNTFLGRDDTNERDETTLRGKLLWQISDGWRARLSGFYANNDNGYDAFALDNGPVTLSDEPGRDEQETVAAALRVTGQLFDTADLISISTFAESDIFFSFDGDWVNETTFLPIGVVYDFRYRNPRERDTVSQELRLVSNDAGRLFGGTTDWVLGAFAQRLDETNAIDSTGDYIEPAVGCDPGVCFADRQLQSDFASTTLAVFGGLDSQISERLSLSFGIRLERWEADYRDAVSDAVVAPGAPPVNNRFAPNDNLIGGHLALSYDWSDELRGYVRLAKGFKAGGFNPSLAALGGSARNVSFSAENLWNLELGLKGSRAGGSLSYDLAVFAMQRDDAQLSQSSQAVANDPNTFVFTTQNGNAHGYGLEASVNWAVTSTFVLHGALGLLETEIDSWRIRPEVEGRDLAHAPGYTLNAGVTWLPVQGVSARLDVNAVDEFYFDISNDEQSSAYRLVNLRIAKDWEQWSLIGWGRNIFDENYATRGFFFGNEPPAFAPTLYTRFGDPRQVGVTLQYRYD